MERLPVEIEVLSEVEWYPEILTGSLAHARWMSWCETLPSSARAVL